MNQQPGQSPPTTNLTSRTLGRLLVALLIIGIVGLTLGLAFFLIFEGLATAIFYAAPYWNPARRLMLRSIGVDLGRRADEQRPLPWHTRLTFVIRLIVRLAMVAFGILILVQNGFAGQNLVWQLLSR